MKHLLIASILFFINLGAFADQRQRQIEYEAINLVIKKYGKGLENRLKGTALNPNYRSWYENDCFVSVAAGTYQESTWSSMEWFSVNVCSDSAEINTVIKAPKNICKKLDLDDKSCWQLCCAAVLDALRPLKNGQKRVDKLKKLIKQYEISYI